MHLGHNIYYTDDDLAYIIRGQLYAWAESTWSCSICIVPNLMNFFYLWVAQVCKSWNLVIFLLTTKNDNNRTDYFTLACAWSPIIARISQLPSSLNHPLPIEAVLIRPPWVPTGATAVLVGVRYYPSWSLAVGHAEAWTQTLRATADSVKN